MENQKDTRAEEMLLSYGCVIAIFIAAEIGKSNVISKKILKFAGCKYSNFRLP